MKSSGLIRCYPIGVIKMVDEDPIDEKILAVPFRDPSLSCYQDISQLPSHTFNEIQHFFTVDKSLENKETVVKEALGREEALRVVAYCIQAYKKAFSGRSEADKGGDRP